MKGRKDMQQRIGRRTVLTFATMLLALSAVTTTQAAAASHEQTSTIAASQPLGSMYDVVDQIGARAMWDQGYTGQGVNVALIDTGFAPIADLLGSGKVVAAADLSAESGVKEATFIDNYGHGTHMAGIIAGRTPGADPALAAKHPEWFLGVAPDAGIVSVKVADNTGGADITQVIAGVDWAVDHAKDLNIRVINLSYASGSSLPYNTDPLTFSLERAWKAGIVVVVAAGNDGRDSHVLSSPAIDPYVIAVAAAEATGTDEHAFKIPAWASSGDGVRNPDIAAPGAHIISLRAPLSRIDVEHPEGLVGDEYFKGSGTSQAAAVTSGAVALLLSANPKLTPDQVKFLLKQNTVDATPRRPMFSGSGVIQVDKAFEASQHKLPKRVQTWPASDGSGPLESARGPVHLVVNGVVIVGDVTALGTRWTGPDWTGTRWTDTTWTGTRWTDGTWRGTRWTDGTWTGTRWTGTRWTDDTWAGAAWDGTRWTGTRWTGTRWTGTRWTGTRWTVNLWSDGIWE